MKSLRRNVLLVATVVILIMVLSGASSVRADSRHCAACGKAIGSSAWVEAEGEVYHREHWVCARCGKPIFPSLYYKHEGKFYDSSCYADNIAPRCDYCGRPIMGEWVGDDTAAYHASCFDDHVAHRCIVDGRPLRGEHFYDGYGNYVCSHHRESIFECHCCGRFLASENSAAGKRYPDGRLTCAVCRETAVMEIDEAERIMEELRAQLEAKGIRVKGKVGLRLVGQGEMNDAAEGLPDDRLGVTLYEKQTTLARIVTFKSFDVMIDYGLSLVRFRSVLAHELMHVWQYQNVPEGQAPQLCEGSCQYAALIILAEDSSGECRLLMTRMRQDSDPVYGVGLRRVVDLVDRLGKDGWLEYLKTNTDFPGGN